MSEKPRVRFCWECGNQLYQNKIFKEIFVDGHTRIVHKACAEDIKRGDRNEFISKADLMDDFQGQHSKEEK